MSQSNPHPVLALNMIKISQFILTTDTTGFFFNTARSFPGTKTHRTFPVGMYTAWKTFVFKSNKVHWNVFVAENLLERKSWLFRIIAWHRTGKQPLPESMRPSLLTHIWASPGPVLITVILRIHSLCISTHLTLVPHICAKESGSIGSDNGLAPYRPYRLY